MDVFNRIVPTLSSEILTSSNRRDEGVRKGTDEKEFYLPTRVDQYIWS